MTELGPWSLVAASAASAPRLAALITEAGGDPRDPRFVASLKHLPGTLAFVVEYEGDAQGCALARAIAGDAEVLAVAVTARARRHGLGRALLKRVLEAATAAGAHEIHLEVSERNGPAQALYRAAGFKESGRRARYYRDGADALVLRRRLAPK